MNADHELRAAANEYLDRWRMGLEPHDPEALNAALYVTGDLRKPE